ncbi:hypothetical protein F5Y12DRAFT_789568 [Xylaria sp. FL1777]|nr:hypothetical protein F5Y12DRAFT_789568 [Xylaria sp. FL1777]
MVQCRDCFDPPIARHINVPRCPERLISFRHPAYPVSANNLLCLSATDDDPVHGIDYNIALAACGIVACNKWHQAWFGEKYEGGDEDQDRYRRVPRPENGILPYKESPYYFFVNEDVKYKYPVVPSFEHWPFPHKSLPDGWKRMCPPSTSGGYLQGTETAHLVPPQAIGWFEVNMMQQYCRLKIRVNPIHDDANMLLLRKDLHFMFDQRQLVVVPKVNSQATMQIQAEGQQQLTRKQIICTSPLQSTSPIGPTCSDQPTYPVIHVLLPDGHDELRNLYHNRLLQPSLVPALDIAPEFLFARFAWAILSDEYYRLLKSDLFQYRVLIFDPETGKRQEQDMRRKALDQNVRLFSRRNRSRNVSPRKRRMGSVEDEVDDCDDLYNDNNNRYFDRIDRELSRFRDEQREANDDDEPDRYYDGEPIRGRSRWRLPNTVHPPPNDLNHCSPLLHLHESSFNSYLKDMSPITMPDSPCSSPNSGFPKVQQQQDQSTAAGKDSLDMPRRKRRRFNS